MFEFLSAPENLPFTVALTVMFGIALLEGVATLLGFGLSNALDALLPDTDVTLGVELEPGVMPDIDSPSAISRFLGWLRIGEVPVLMLLIIFLTGFGLVGLALQSFLANIIGSLLPGVIVAIPAVFIALPIVRLLGGLLNSIMPKDETDAVAESSLVGRIATITLGTARAGSPAEAKVRDVHGTTHYVMVEPDSDGNEFSSGKSVLLIKKQGAVFKAIDNPNPALVD